MIDEFISREEMLNSVKRIQYSLNCRFEKDADLFISKQKSQEIKDMIHNSNWQGIRGIYITNSVSADILTIEIMKNSWLINTISKNDSKHIEEIFKSCNKDIFMEKASKIISNEIYSPLCIKKLIIPMYYMNVDINICKQILDSNKDNLLFNEQIRKICVKRVLDICEKPRELYNTMKKYLNSDEIYTTSDVLKEYVQNLDKEESFIYDLGKYIFENEIEDETNCKDSRWFRIFRSLGKVTFDICKEYLDELGKYDNSKDFSISITRYLMAYQLRNGCDNREYFENEWIKLFDDKNGVKRLSLILGTRNILHKGSKEKIINKILENPTITKKQKEMVEAILNDSDNLYDPINECILEILLKNKLNSNDKNSHMNFLVMSFLNRHKSVKDIDLLLEHINNKNVEDFIIRLISQSSKINDKMLRYLLEFVLINNKQKDEEFNNIKEKIILFIKSNSSDFKNVKDIIEKYDFNLYKNVFGNI